VAGTAAGSMDGHMALAKALADNGVDTMFGVVGYANLFVVDSFRRHFGGTYVAASNEVGATFMALGHGYTSGKVGVATCTHGPGMTNTVSALIEGVKARIPMVLVAGDTDPEDRANNQNVAQRDFAIVAGAGFEQAASPRTMVADLATALRRARVERRPIVFNVPAYYQWEKIDYQPVKPVVPDLRGMVSNNEQLENAVGIIAASRRPIILAGRAALNAEARAALLRLSERTGALLATTLKASNLFKGEAYDLGVFGTLSKPVTVEEIIASDCILAFGASISPYTASMGAFVKGKRIVQVDNDPAAFGKNFPVDAAVLGDVAAAADAIVGLLDMAEIPPSAMRNDDLAARLKDQAHDYVDHTGKDTIGFQRALVEIEKAVPTDRFLVNDGGRYLLDAFKTLTFADARKLYIPTASGSIGTGMASAIGASFTDRKSPTVLITGDGGFMLGGLAEFNTAVRNKVDLIVVLCNDGGYGREEVEFRARNMPDDLAFFDWPEFSEVATALGGQGIAVRTPEDLKRATDAIRTRDRPVLIDLKVDPYSFPGLSGH